MKYILFKDAGQGTWIIERGPGWNKPPTHYFDSYHGYWKSCRFSSTLRKRLKKRWDDVESVEEITEEEVLARTI